MSSDKKLIIIPTYNEIENIEKLIRDIVEIDRTIDILIVDDNSPDGTGEQVGKLKEQFNNLFLIQREGKRGLGTAYVAGFNYALENEYTIMFGGQKIRLKDPLNFRYNTILKQC